MISCNIKGHYWKNSWSIIIPHEVSHYFVGDLKKIYEEGRIQKIDYTLPDHYLRDLEIPVDKLHTLIKAYEFLEKNLDKVTKIAPLPKQIGKSDGYYIPGFVTNSLSGNDEVYGTKTFTKEDMLLIISLIKKKILEAKEKGETLVFSGD